MLLQINFQNQLFTVNTVADNFGAALIELFQNSNYFETTNANHESIAYGIELLKQSIITATPIPQPHNVPNDRATNEEYDNAWNALRSLSSVGAELTGIINESEPGFDRRTDILNFEALAVKGIIPQEVFVSFRGIRALLLNTDVNTHTISSSSIEEVIANSNRDLEILRAAIQKWRADHP